MTASFVLTVPPANVTRASLPAYLPTTSEPSYVLDASVYVAPPRFSVTSPRRASNRSFVGLVEKLMEYVSARLRDATSPDAGTTAPWLQLPPVANDPPDALAQWLPTWSSIHSLN